MTFKEIALKNFSYNFMRYLSYFLCSSFAIMIFFIYSNLALNGELFAKLGDPSIETYFLIFMVIVALFSIFFISYSHSAFTKSREKEFGLYLTLGMTNKDIFRIISLENFLIAVLSLGFGMLAGTVFSRLFFMVVVKLLGINDLAFNLSFQSYWLTLVLFLVIFTFIIFISKLKTGKLEISNLLKGRKNDLYYHRYHGFLGIIGILLILTSLTMLQMHLKGAFLAGVNYLPPVFIGLSIIAIYLTIAYFGGSLIFLSKNLKGIYYRNIMQVTELKYKFSEHKKIIFIMTILSIIVIYFIGFAYSSFVMVGDYVAQDQPYHFMYVSRVEDKPQIEAEFNQLINSRGLEVVESRSLNFLKGQISKSDRDEEAWFGSVEIISSRQFNRFSNSDLKVEIGQAVTLLKLAEAEQNQWFNENNLQLKLAGQEYSFKFIDEIYNPLVNNSRKTSRFVVILNTLDYQEIEKEVQSNYKGVYRLFDFKDWQQADGLTEDLSGFLAANLIKSPNNSKVVRADFSSRIQLFKILKQQYSVYLFLMSFIGLLFFVSSGSVLYLKLFSDLKQDRVRFRKLFRIGIASKEIKKLISRELGVLFFLPTALGSIIALVFIIITTTNTSMQSEILLNSLVIIILYFIFQLVFYFIACRKYSQQVIRGY